jgi:hypothetical protein
MSDPTKTDKDNKIDDLDYLPQSIFSEWIRISIPGTSVIATFNLPPEMTEDFIDFIYPPTILYFAKSAMESMARLLNTCENRELEPLRPNKREHNTLEKQVKEWSKCMEVVHVDRVNKRSRILKYKGADKCAMNFVWTDHSEWPDWPKNWPERFISGTMAQKGLAAWNINRPVLRLKKSNE